MQCIIIYFGNPQSQPRKHTMHTWSRYNKKNYSFSQKSFISSCVLRSDSTSLYKIQDHAPGGGLRPGLLVCSTTGKCKQQAHLGPQLSFSLTPHTSSPTRPVWSQSDTEGPYDVCSLVTWHLTCCLGRQQCWRERKGVN